MTMLLLRNAQTADLEDIHQLAIESGIGLTTLPKNMDLLKTRLALSVDSIHKEIVNPGLEYYLFVLENPITHQIVGTSAIQASLGHDVPSYTYRLSNRTRLCHELGIRRDDTWLYLVNDDHGKSELCTLYLKPDYRHSHHGVFLSRARFLFMAQHPMRFESHVIAEMRGVTDEQGNSPFWDGVGQHFFQMPFHQADELTLSTNKQFIDDLIPDHPIHVQLLNKNAQAVIGKPHQATEPAMHILLNEGFHYANCVDIFDAGPIIEAVRDDIQTIRTSQTAIIADIVDDISPSRFLISNTQLNFRATLGAVMMNQNQAVIHPETAELLQVKQGDTIRFATLK